MIDFDISKVEVLVSYDTYKELVKLLKNREKEKEDADENHIKESNDRYCQQHPDGNGGHHDKNQKWDFSRPAFDLLSLSRESIGPLIIAHYRPQVGTGTTPKAFLDFEEAL